jgi:heme a synthase
VTTLAYSGTDARGASDARLIAFWLLACAVMVFGMAVIGAITRLTESGLSIVEWQPLMGTLPPLSETEWQRVFALYQQTPEYIHRNAGMDLAGFKQIFFWEWFHRVWGRLIGVVFALPLLWFWVSGRLARANGDGRLGVKLVGLFLLGGLQGGLGWYMVMSGLVDRPSVSHYRLAAHLGVACLIYALMLWVAADLLWPRPMASGLPQAVRRGLRRHGWVALALVAATMVWGAFVAGLDAGFAYNTFPLMDGRLLAPGAGSLRPFWLNLFDNTALVQFTHRWLAILTAGVVLALAARALQAAAPGRLRMLAVTLGAMVVVQVVLGVSTLVLAVPLALGAAHQAGALLLLGLAVLFVRETRRTEVAKKIP